MKRERYLAKYPRLLTVLGKVALATGLDKDDADDVLSLALNRVLAKKTYTRIAEANLRGFLVASVRYAAKDWKKEQSMRRKRVCPLPEMADESVLVETLESESETEAILCPFCHKGDLNMYAACKECHTILPSSTVIRRNVLRMDEVSLAVDFEYDKKLDIQRALSQLTDREQAVVRAVVMGEDSFATLASLTGLSDMSLHRAWVSAKQKLQCILHAYASEHCPKRSQSQFRQALNAAPVA